jgi:hypothetical protein
MTREQLERVVRAALLNEVPSLLALRHCRLCNDRVVRQLQSAGTTEIPTNNS